MDFNTIFGGETLTLEQFIEKIKGMKLVDLNDGGYVAKEKYDKIDGQLKAAKGTITTLEGSKTNVEELTAELNKYKDAEEKRLQAEQEAERRAGLKARFDPLRGESKFLNEGTESWIFSEFEKALADKTNEGKSDAEVYAAVTKDKNIYVNPQEPFKMPPMGGNPPAKGGKEYLEAKYRNNPWYNG